MTTPNRELETKKQINIRLSPEANRTAQRLQADFGYENRTDAMEGSLVCWEYALLEASRKVEGVFSRQEWNLMADICNGTAWAYGHTGSSPAFILAAEIEDGHRLDGAGYRWLSEEDFPSQKEQKHVDERVARLLTTIRSLDYTEAWGVIRAVCWFWQHTEVNHQADEWWKVEFRRAYKGTQP